MNKQKTKILILDDDEHVVLTARMILKEHFGQVDTLLSPKTLESVLRKTDYDIILLDMNFKAGLTSGNEGIFWLNRIQSLAPHTQVVLQTAYGDIDLAVKSMKEGAVDFLPKPWDKEKLITTIETALKQSTSRKENKSTDDPHLYRQHEERSLIGESQAMKTVIDMINQVAATDANVLISGENGTGKDVIAHAIHARSSRSAGPFVSVDMGAIPASLFESEMFGHERGAFTDAKEARKGKFEWAHRGTLFLDEIGNLSSELQVKLLAVLQNRRITRIGSMQSKEIDVRLIAATNAPVREMVNAGTFRQDLFYRINTVEIHIPPLRERREDIPPLMKHFLDVFNLKYHKRVEVDLAVINWLTKYHWPGNVRELQHAIERAVILSTGNRITKADFQLIPESSLPESESSLNLSVVEKNAIRQAIRKCNGNLSRAAEELGIGRTTLYRKLEEYGITT